MDSNSYNSIHIVTESVIVGAVSMYFYKKISDLETIVKDLQQQVVVQNGQLNELKNYLSSSVVSPPHEGAERPRSPQKTLLHIPTQREMVSPPQGYSLPFRQRVAHLSATSSASRDRSEVGFAQSREPDPSEVGRSLSLPEGRIGNDELVDCSDGVCKLVSGGKKVVISKISKQAEFDRESFQVNHPLKVETFKRTSPNPIIKSVTPKPSESISETVEQILNEINNE
jgi:hypothetical protein